jgi:DNA-binding LytR/AlgR family response regulator
MIRVAVVEDEKESLDIVLRCLKRFEEEEGIGFVTTVFRDGLDFISGYRPLYDIVFMDIEMPMLNGMSAAKKLRKVDSSVALVFITRLRQYALLGYEVDAVGYLLKPLEYAPFQRQIEKIMHKNRFLESESVMVKTVDGMAKIDMDKIMYVEINGHYLLYHMTDGIQKAYGQMHALSEALPKDKFFRCHKSFLIHLKYVKKIDKSGVWVGDEEIPVGRPHKKELLDTFNRYVGRSMHG